MLSTLSLVLPPLASLYSYQTIPLSSENLGHFFNTKNRTCHRSSTVSWLAIAIAFCHASKAAAESAGNDAPLLSNINPQEVVTMHE